MNLKTKKCKLCIAEKSHTLFRSKNSTTLLHSSAEISNWWKYIDKFLLMNWRWPPSPDWANSRRLPLILHQLVLWLYGLREQNSNFSPFLSSFHFLPLFFFLSFHPSTFCIHLPLVFAHDLSYPTILIGNLCKRVEWK